MQVFKGLRGKKHFHKLTVEDVKEKTQKKQEEEAKAADAVQTILVPIEKNNIWTTRTRGYSAKTQRDFSFTEQHRTRSGGYNKQATSLEGEQLAAARDMLNGQTIIGEGGNIDSSNRHIILNVYKQLRNLLYERTETSPGAQVDFAAQGS
mmetsp:Transcript_33314/g.43888  ORF Transcript_33314/g.43888 Transcript_33314/m.43888 type:complete len:150 (+) Transcript_33314:174-623(+)